MLLASALVATADRPRDMEEGARKEGGNQPALDLHALLEEIDRMDNKPRRQSSARRRLSSRDPEYLEDDEEDEPQREKSTRVELRHAEERVRQLEAQLLDAEETICHLKAEKLEAWRQVERLSQALERHDGALSDDTQADMTRGHGEGALQSLRDANDVVVRYRNQIYELESRLSDAQQYHTLEQEERMAVIREQEREILVLKERLDDVHEHAEEWQTRYEELLAATRQQRKPSPPPRTNSSTALLEEFDDTPTSSSSWRTPRSSGGIEFAWQEDLIRHPTPHFDLDSPEVQYLLQSWTQNIKKLQYIRTWLTHVVVETADLPDDFPMGIELPRLLPEIRDGFLTLVVPLLRKQTRREIQVHTRQYNDDYHTDVRIRVVPRLP
ncbi:hypothetical protein Poli38472_010325 [Pythium oligandrum]|uniref:Uncharacterized protein n=1 Tax=Pythium oligandrum TaxID=41045 RepID=A0A8K1C2V5_PYTOL|nr:hypothetical protein Poli38472_010325 [Pythium oligandrum]|eukprot:TMW55443.1 hypothetical protein Poli38472_010325 [Pythium oligandrum]